MKSGWTKILAGFLILVLIVGLAGVIRQQMDYRKGDADYSEAEELAGVFVPEGTAVTGADGREAEKDPEAAALETIDLDALREVNPDVVGWICIPGTKISYPLVQADDNEYYLDQTWKRARSSVGAIFLECQVSPDLTDFNTIIYGHRMKNNTMFGRLKEYIRGDLYEQAPAVYIATDGGVNRYDIFAAYEADVSWLLYVPGVSAREEKEEILRCAAEHSVIDTGISPSPDDRILSLITCTGRGYSSRLTVQAVLTQQWEAD